MARSMGGSRGGGRSGGSRSGGGRSSSGRSMGSSRSGTSRAFGSGHSGGSSVRGSGRSYGGQTSSGNPHMGGSFNNSGYHGGNGYNHYHHNHHYHHHHGYHRYYNTGYYRHTPFAGGCSSFIIVFILLITFIAIFMSTSVYRHNNNMYYKYSAPSYKDTYSNVERTKFNGEVRLNGYYSDPDGILYDDEHAALENGLKHFYKTTGVCAYVYFVAELNPNIDGIEEASRLYDELFSDEGHLLLLYDYENAYMYDAQGYEIATTIDSEAIDIIYDYVEAQWSKDSENLGAIFGDGCAKAADRIMFKERTFMERNKAIIIVVISAIAAIIILNVAFKWWKAKVAQKNKEQEDLERTLKTPLETFGETPVSDLERKYDDDPNNNPQ